MQLKSYTPEQSPRATLFRLTGLDVAESTSSSLLRDVRNYRCWLEFTSGQNWTEHSAARRWLQDVYEPALQLASQNVQAMGA